jgi:hypothetical protein
VTQSIAMQSNWAAEHLLVIRTLMERSAIYRRALAPIVLSLGFLGLVAAVVGWGLSIARAHIFVEYWSGVGLAGVSGAYLLARRQALKAAEPFWSAPTRRITEALLPPLFVGFVVSSVAVFVSNGDPAPVWWLVPLWMVLYGCALHAAGFFMPRGMKLFGWGFIVIGCAAAIRLALSGTTAPLTVGHFVMGSTFGGLHLAYGLYLYFTEKRMNEP